MDTSIIDKAIQPRKHLDKIRQQVTDAVCLYTGGRHIESYIRPYSEQEDALKLANRRSFACSGYENYVKRVCGQLIEGIFSSTTVIRETGIKDIDEYLSEEYSDYAQKELYPPAMYLCELFIQVGLNSYDAIIDDENASRDDVLSAGIHYVPRPIFPQHVLNFQEKNNGELAWISLSNGSDSDTIEIITENELIIYNKKDESTTSKPNNLGFVPVMRFFDKCNHACDGEIGDAMLQEIIDKSQYSLQWIAALAEMGWLHLNAKMVTGPDTAELIKKMGMSNAKVIVESADKDSYVPTRYLQLPSYEMDTLDKIIYERIPDSIMLAAHLRDRTADKSLSGFAKWLDSKPEFGALKYASNLFRRIDAGVMRMLIKCRNRTPNNVVKIKKLIYPSSFDVKSSSEIIADISVAALAAAAIVQSPTGNGEISKQYYRVALPNASTDISRAIEDEINDEVNELLAAEDADIEGRLEGAEIDPFADNPNPDDISKKDVPARPMKNNSGATAKTP